MRDGYDEIIVSQGPDPKNTMTLRVFKRDGTTVTEYTAFDSKYGLTISSADLDGDWLDELIVGMGPDPKNPAQLRRVFKSDGSLMLELRPYDNKYGYGVTVASTDLDGDGIDEIITGLGFSPQNAAWVKVFKADGTEITSFLAYPENIGYGVKVSTGKTGE